MRVLHVVRQFHPSVGGLEDFVLALAKQQRREGLWAEVVTLNRLTRQPGGRLPDCDCVEGVPVRRIGYFGSYKYPIALGVLRHLHGFDLVHVHGVDFFCDYLALTRFVHRKPIVLSTHGGFFHTNFARILKKVFFSTVTRFSLTQFRRVIANSTNDLALFRRVSNKRLVMIENGVDTDKFAGSGSPTFAPVLAYIGRFASNKGLNELLDTFDIIGDAIPDARLHIIGNDWDGLLPGLRQRIASARNGNRIEIHTGLSDDGIKQVIKDCSFFVSASQYEGFGLTVIEAMSAGLLPILNRIKSFETIVKKTSVGLLTDFSNPTAAAHKAVEFMSETRPHYDESRAAAVAASAQYNWKIAAERFSEEYESVLGLRARTLLGVRLESKSREEAVHVIDEAFVCGRRLNVAFVNAHTLNIATRMKHFRSTLSRFLVFNDGLGVDIASRLKFGKTFAENLNGTDFVPYFLSSTKHSYRIFLIGSTSEVIAEAAKRFSIRWPQHRIVGFHDGFFAGAADIEETCRAAREAKADLVLVGMGNPLQELWIDEHGPATGATLLIAVGALFDFTAGRVQRAPLWVRNIRCEWVYRFLQEPKRLWRRYLFGNIIFIKNVLLD